MDESQKLNVGILLSGGFGNRFENQVNNLFNCGHAILCDECYIKLSNPKLCPLCREPINDRYSNIEGRSFQSDGKKRQSSKRKSNSKRRQIFKRKSKSKRRKSSKRKSKRTYKK